MAEAELDEIDDPGLVIDEHHDRARRVGLTVSSLSIHPLDCGRPHGSSRHWSGFGRWIERARRSASGRA